MIKIWNGNIIDISLLPCWVMTSVKRRSQIRLYRQSQYGMAIMVVIVLYFLVLFIYSGASYLIPSRRPHELNYESFFPFKIMKSELIRSPTLTRTHLNKLKHLQSLSESGTDLDVYYSKKLWHWNTSKYNYFNECNM